MRYLPALCAAVVLAGCGSDRRNDDSYEWIRQFPAEKEGISISISVDADSMTADQTLHAQIELVTSQNIRAVIPDPESIPLEGFLLRRWKARSPATDDMGRDIQRLILTLEPMIPGDGGIGPIDFRYERRENENWVSHTMLSAAGVVTILSLGVPAEGDVEFRGPRGVAHRRENTIIYYMVAGIILLGVLIAAYLFVRRTGRKPGPSVPPHRHALRALAELENRDLVPKGEFRIFYSELSEIMRGYIEGSMGFSALEQTTHEIMQNLFEVDRIERDDANGLRELLEEADMVKFAKYRPSRESAQERLYQGKVFIRNTAPPEEDSA